MTEEIMPREDRLGKILTFISGCLVGVIGVFTVAAVSELSRASQPDDSETGGEQDETLPLLEGSSNQGN